MTDPITREDLISRGAAATALRIHPNTFDRLAKEVGLRRYRVRGDNRAFYLKSEVDQYVDPIVEITADEL